MTHTNFIKGPMLGRGVLGKVYLCCDSDTGELFAVKEFEIDKIGGKREKELQAIMNEVKILSDIRHERIVQYLGYQQGEQVLSIFLEYMPGKSLWQHMQDFGAVSENVTKKLTKQILEGVVFLHSEKIIHRDIKAGNILRDTQGNVKLSDFGISKQLRSITSVAGLKTSVGSPYWMAPEIIKEEGYGCNADLWSVGCTVVELLTTKPPFAEFEHAIALYKIATYEKPSYDLPPDSSRCLKRFLDILFQTKSTNRTSAKKLLQHEFITSHSFKEVEPDQEAYSEDTLCEENNTIISQAALEQKDDDGKDKYDEHLHVTNAPQDRHKQEDGYDDKTCEEYTHRTNVSQAMTERENGDGQETCVEHIISNVVKSGNSEKEAYSEDTLCEENNTMISQAALEQKDDDGKDKYDEHLHVTNVPQDRHKQEDGYDDKTCGEYTHRINVSQSMTERENGDGQETCVEHIISNVVKSGNSEKETRPSEICTHPDHSLIELAVENHIDLLLVGKTGHGLSSTGNTILGKVCFKTSCAALSETQDIASAICEYKNRIIRIVDGPGVYNTHFSDAIGIAMLITKLQNALQLNPDGFHAFLLVFDYRIKFNHEEIQCIRILKAIFGDNFLRNHCILIFTKGDFLDISFEQYCKEQKDNFQEVYQECEKRAVLFDNKSKDEDVKEKQMSLLLKFVDQMQEKGRRYTSYDFKIAEINRHIFLDKMELDKNVLKIIVEIFEYIHLKKI